MEIQEKIALLLDWFRPFGSCLVAFSGGVDSSVVAFAAAKTLGEKAKAITAWSPSSCGSDQENAALIAKTIGIHHLLFESREFDAPDYVRNDRNRCYVCKRIRFQEMVRLAEEQHFNVLVDGSNAEDTSDFRPGKTAAKELGIRSPLEELGFSKSDVRAAAKQWNLPHWNDPAQPCLSTRVEYGKELSDALLRRIERAESYLAGFGFSPLRVRVHERSLVRIEIPVEQIPRLCESPLRENVVREFRELDFQFISLDLEGFRSGKMNG